MGTSMKVHIFNSGHNNWHFIVWKFVPLLPMFFVLSISSKDHRRNFIDTHKHTRVRKGKSGEPTQDPIVKTKLVAPAALDVGPKMKP